MVSDAEAFEILIDTLETGITLVRKGVQFQQFQPFRCMF
jgi:hypothetical protein